MRRSFSLRDAALPVRDGVVTVVDTTPLLPDTSHLDQSRPFISAKRLRTFSFAVLIGASFVGTVYYLVSRTLAARCEREMLMIRTISEQTRASQDRVVVDRNAALPRFVAPQTYNALVEKMKASEEAAQAKLGPMTHGPLLHQEIAHRAKLGWNEGIFNIQVALEAYGLEWKRRREEQVQQNIELSVRLLGYEPVNCTRLP